MSLPAYAYAANNPVRYVDPDGRRFINPTRRQRNAIDALIANPFIGDRIRALDESDDVLISLREERGFKKGAFTDYTPGSKGGGCQPRQPASVVITYDEDVTSALLSKYFGLDVTTLVNLLGHELGHTDYAHDVWWNGLEPVEGGSESRAIGFEDLTRSGSYRRRHDVILGDQP